MQEIERVVNTKIKKNKKIKCFGINSAGILSVVFQDDSLLNFDKEEAMSLKHFLNGCYEKEVDGDYHVTVQDDSTHAPFYV